MSLFLSRTAAPLTPYTQQSFATRVVTCDFSQHMALGATVPIATPGGEVKVHVPAGSSSGRRLRLRGEGMPNPQGSPGDLYAEVSVMVPAKLTDRERALFAELAAISTFDPRT